MARLASLGSSLACVGLIVSAAVCSSSGNASTKATTPKTPTTGATTTTTLSGISPGAGAPGQGTPVVGAEYARAAKAARAKYPGTIQTVEKVASGGYLVHVIQASGAGEVHVRETADFVVTGADAGGPPGGPGGPGFGGGTDVIGPDYDKAAKSATAKYPGSVERVERRPDGTYVVHVRTATGEVHVVENKDFVVTGTEGGPGGGPGLGVPGGVTPPTRPTSSA